MKHPGTYNGNPLSAAAGVAVLSAVATGDPTRLANAAARDLRNGFNALFAANGYSWVAYGDFSTVRVIPHDGERPAPETGDNAGFVPFGGDVNALDGPKNAKQVAAVRQGMLLNGVDWWGLGGMTSCAHTADDVAKTVRAMEATLAAMKAEGLA
jgi:glutamate-1-semialdehyde 2,1-aminomutase